MAAPTPLAVWAEQRAASYVALRKYRKDLAPDPPPADWPGWFAEVFPSSIQPPYAPYHAEFWAWVWSIEPDHDAPPFVAIWPRGFGKSQSAEVACAVVAARRSRRYVLYVCETQDRADTHVQNVAGLLESTAYAKHYTQQAERRIGKYGNSQGWRRNRIRTASGLTIDALGLDTAARGAKVDDDRPDLIICDDIDGLLDSPGTTKRKIETLTKSILPARAPHAAVLVVQNLIHADGIVAQLADNRADFLANRHVSGPHPAITNAVFEQDSAGRWQIVGGETTWDAQPIDALQRELDDIGITAFRAEKQHEVNRLEGGIFGHLDFRHCRWADVPPLDRIVVWVDPAVTDTDHSDSHGIQADGLGRDGTIYRLYSWESRTSPEDAIRRAILKAVELNAEAVGVETDQGGDTWKSVYDRVSESLRDAGQLTAIPRFKQAKAGARGPKAHRASQMLADYERGVMVHVTGTHETLERALNRYLLRKPYDLVDAAFWSWADLRTKQRKVQVL